MSPDILIDTGTFIHPAIVVLIIVSCILIPVINIRYSIFLMVLLSIIIPKTQRISIFTLNFNIIRLILLTGWIKIIFNKELKLVKTEKIDKTIIYYVMVSSIVYVIQQSNLNAVIHMLGFSYDVIGTYFLYRIIIKRKEDISTIINSLAIVSVILAIFMFYEQWTGKNWFYVIGAENKFTPARMGLLRSSGPFGHAITAGLFGATMIPLCFSMWRHKWGSHFFGIVGMLSACIVVFTSSSMTSLVAGVSGIIALLFWPLRNRMRIVQYGILFTAFVFQIIMASPLWGLIKRMDFIKGASVEHRFMLVDNLINHFNEWFLFGFSSTEKWGFGMWDHANQYFSEAVSGGLFKIALFIMIIVFCFRIIGEKVKIIKDTPSRKKFWALGSALFANAVGFLGISLWDQMLFVWWLFLALITSTCLINDGEYVMINEVQKKLGEGQRGPEQHQSSALV